MGQQHLFSRVLNPIDDALATADAGVAMETAAAPLQPAAFCAAIVGFVVVVRTEA